MKAEALKELCKEEMRRVSLFRMDLPQKHPFWGALAFQISFIPNPGMKGFAATDCTSRVWFNPVYTRHLTQRQLGFVMLHELGHVVLISSERQRGRDRHLFNVASDYKINEMVSKVTMPGYGHRPLYDPPGGEMPDIGEVNIYLEPAYDGM